jgi:hypothetical protein
MKGLTPDDLLPLGEYLGRRRELFEAHQRYLDRYRRVRIGPRAALIFENRQTLWFRLHEILRVARLTEPTRIAQELALYNALLPDRDQLAAVLHLDLDETRWLTELAPWRDLRGEEIVLRLGATALPANLYTARPEDRCSGAAQWVQFTVTAELRALLADLRQPASLDIQRENYRHSSGPLPEEIRRSLIEDLDLSAQAAA